MITGQPIKIEKIYLIKRKHWFQKKTVIRTLSIFQILRNARVLARYTHSQGWLYNLQGRGQIENAGPLAQNSGIFKAVTTEY